MRGVLNIGNLPYYESQGVNNTTTNNKHNNTASLQQGLAECAVVPGGTKGGFTELGMDLGKEFGRRFGKDI